jgi:hypothetical protein
MEKAREQSSCGASADDGDFERHGEIGGLQSLKTMEQESKTLVFNAAFIYVFEVDDDTSFELLTSVVAFAWWLRLRLPYAEVAVYGEARVFVLAF